MTKEEYLSRVRAILFDDENRDMEPEEAGLYFKGVRFALEQLDFPREHLDAAIMQLLEKMLIKNGYPSN